MRIDYLKYIITYLICLVSLAAFAGDLTQNIKGVVLDESSLGPLPGVNVFLTNNPAKGTTTDYEGRFRLDDVEIGIVSITFRYISYEERVLSNLRVGSGKELELEVKMKEQITEMNAVVVRARNDKDKAINEIATVSARMLSVEEAKRYSGAKNDPARMAQNFAGVSGSNDARNDIIIRGNSPLGLLWRMEGINIPSPNHFGTVGTTGGPVTILNTNNLKDSDFMTAAFPAEYGNATAGVFDLNMRNGNRDKFEFLGQVSFNGFEVGMEGPFSKRKRASYMVNYRYSTLQLVDVLGAKFITGAAVPEYQDITFKINAPTEKAGKFTIFGIGGISFIEFLDSERDPDADDLYTNEGTDLRTGSDMGVVGVSHTYFMSQNTYGKAIFSASLFANDVQIDSISDIDLSATRIDEGEFQQLKYSLGYSINHKFNARNKLNTGFIYDIYDVAIDFRTRFENQLVPIKKFDGVPSLLQMYITWQHRLNDRFTFNTGLHHQHFFLNQSWMVEPRVNMQYEFPGNQSISAGVSLHSQMQPLESYFIETILNDGTSIQTNRDLELVKSQHFVFGYNKTWFKNFRLKAELYSQYIIDAAVEEKTSSFSMLNAGAGFALPSNDSLMNGGKGINYGLEITLEKFLSKGYYILFTVSLFDSRYKGSDDIWRNTAFNSNYIINTLGGKEFQLKNGKDRIALDSKVAFAGGQRYTEIDLDRSIDAGDEIRFDDRAFEKQFEPYFRLDFKISLIHEGKRATQQFSCDLQNITNQKNIFTQQYNNRTQAVERVYQMGFFPDLLYKVMF